MKFFHRLVACFSIPNPKDDDAKWSAGTNYTSDLPQKYDQTFQGKMLMFSYQIEYTKKYSASFEAHATAGFFKHKTHVEPLTYNSAMSLIRQQQWLGGQIRSFCDFVAFSCATHYCKSQGVFPQNFPQNQSWFFCLLM